MSDKPSRISEDWRNGVVVGSRRFQRRSFLLGAAGGVAGAVAAGLVGPGVAEGASKDDYNLEETRAWLRSFPVYGHPQAGIATAPPTAAIFLAFDNTAAHPPHLTTLFP